MGQNIVFDNVTFNDNMNTPTPHIYHYYLDY